MAYLDHAATTPMLAEALDAYVAAARVQRRCVAHPAQLGRHLGQHLGQHWRGGRMVQIGHDGTSVDARRAPPLWGTALDWALTASLQGPAASLRAVGGSKAFIFAR